MAIHLPNAIRFFEVSLRGFNETHPAVYMPRISSLEQIYAIASLAKKHHVGIVVQIDKSDLSKPVVYEGFFKNLLISASFIKSTKLALNLIGAENPEDVQRGIKAGCTSITLRTPVFSEQASEASNQQRFLENIKEAIKICRLNECSLFCQNPDLKWFDNKNFAQDLSDFSRSTEIDGVLFNMAPLLFKLSFYQELRHAFKILEEARKQNPFLAFLYQNYLPLPRRIAQLYKKHHLGKWMPINLNEVPKTFHFQALAKNLINGVFDEYLPDLSFILHLITMIKLFIRKKSAEERRKIFSRARLFLNHSARTMQVQLDRRIQFLGITGWAKELSQPSKI